MKITQKAREPQIKPMLEQCRQHHSQLPPRQKHNRGENGWVKRLD